MTEEEYRSLHRAFRGIFENCKEKTSPALTKGIRASEHWKKRSNEQKSDHPVRRIT